MTDLTFNCPHCEHQIHAPTSSVGKTGRCKSCGEKVTVPFPSFEREEESIPEVIVEEEPGRIKKKAGSNVITFVLRHKWKLIPITGLVVLLCFIAVYLLKGGDSSEPTGRVAVLVSQLNSKDREVVFDAAEELGSMGVSARAAIPALVDLATFNEHGSFRIHPGLAAKDALEKIDKQLAVKYLIEATTKSEKRYWACRILGEYGDDAVPAIPSLVEALRAVEHAKSSEERSGSEQAAAALAKIRPKGLSALISEMSSYNKEVRHLAVLAIPRGSAGKPAVERLTDRLADDDSGIRKIASFALQDIAADAEYALPLLKHHYQREQNPSVKIAMGTAYLKISESAQERKATESQSGKHAGQK